ncbi:MAG: nitroreductase family protein [Pelolinea sp.]|nr:nitroreductase family protein [Pelolinea sp.]
MQNTIEFKQSILVTIKQRKSIRTYQPIPISSDKRKTLQQAIGIPGNNLFRFAWFEQKSRNGLAERIGTYGVIKGAQTFVVGVLRKDAEGGKDAAIQFGYEFEQIILKATELGLGTCWLGGIFNAATFAKGIDLQQNEKIVMLSPVGIPSEKKHLISKLTSRAANSNTRKPWQKLFYESEIGFPLSKEAAGKFAPALEMVRLAPSAVNSQPWRVIRSENGFHFYAAATNYFALGKERFLRYNDMGIAMAHFELACKDLGLAGEWIFEKQLDDGDEPNLEYIRSWKTGD